MCLEGLTTDLYFFSDNYLYPKKCFSNLNFESPISRQAFSCYFPTNKLVNDKVQFEKKIKNNFRIVFDLDGFDQDGFNRKAFDRKGFNRKGIDEYGYNSNKELDFKEKLKQAIRENPNTYQYATLNLKHNVDLVIFFLEQGRSFSLISKHLQENKKVVRVAVAKYPNSSQENGKNLKNDHDIFKLAFQQDREVLRYASERLEKTNKIFKHDYFQVFYSNGISNYEETY